MVFSNFDQVLTVNLFFNVNYNRYSSNETVVSEIGFGGAQLGLNAATWQNVLEKASVSMIHRSLDLGINFFDTAPIYGHGLGEIRLGKGLKRIDRSKVVVNTKFGGTHTGKINFSHNYIRESLEGSLKRLNMDYVDSFIFHNPPIEYLNGNENPHYEILERLIEEGKIKTYGASLDSADEMNLFLKTTNCGVIEPLYNILHQDTGDAFDLALEKNVSLIVKSPLDSGWLSGKYNADSIFKDSRKRWTRTDIERRTQLLFKIKDIIHETDELAQVAISFCLDHDAVSTVIPGNRNLNQLESNVRSTRGKVSKDQIGMLKEFYLKEVKHLKLPY